MKHEIKRICPASLGKILAAIYFIVGFVVSAFALIMSFVGKGGNVRFNGPMGFGSTYGTETFYIILYPFLSALIAMIAGFIAAWVYNGISSKIGGIVITLNEKNGA